MLCPPPGQMMIDVPVSFSLAGRYTATVGMETFVSRMTGLPPGSFWSGFVVSLSGGNSLVSPGGLPGQMGFTMAGFASSARSGANPNNPLSAIRHPNQPDNFPNGMMFLP